MNNTDIHLGPDYGITALNGSAPLSGQLTTAQVQSTMPNLWGWAKYKGWSDAEIMSLGRMEAAWHDAFWAGENGNFASPNPGHAINITVPNGRFAITFPLPFAQGRYRGQGSRFSDQNGQHNYGSTHLFIDHARWKASRSTDRIIMRSANWGVDGGYGAWCHHYVIEGFYFGGARRTMWMPTGAEESAGIGAWDSGEASEIRNCYFDGFEKDGILMVRGTPAYVSSCSAFNTNRFGIALVGGGSLTCTNISGDESGIALVGVIPGYGRPGSGKLTINGAKQETSTSVEFRPWKGSSFLYVDGWVSASIQGVSYASTGTQPYDFVSWRRGPGNFSQIEVSGTLFFGNSPRCLFYDETNNREYLFEGNAWQNTMQSFVWHETQGLRTPWGSVPFNQRTGQAGRLQHIGTDGASSWETAGIYDPTGGAAQPTDPPPPPPPPPVDPPPVDPPPPPPVEPPPPVDPPPPPTTNKARWTFSSGNTTTIRGAVGGINLQSAASWRRASSMSGGRLRNTNPNMRYTTSVDGVTVVMLTGFVPQSLGAGQMLLHSEQDYRGLVINSEGRICDNRSGSDVPLTAPLTDGTRYDLTLNLPSPMNVRSFGSHEGGGSSVQFGELDEVMLL